MEPPLEVEPFRPLIEDGLGGKVRLGLLRARPVAVGPSGPKLDSQMRAAEADLRARYRGLAPSEIAPLAHARDLYKAFGVDPTRTRPSSEALLRRILKDQPLPRILNAVDLANLCAVEFLLPIGLYDAGAIQPPVVLRAGRPGEHYPGIRKTDVHVEGRPVLADTEGPFGNPTSDSLRTSVRNETRDLLMVLFAPASYPAPRLQAHLDRAAEWVRAFLPGADAPPGVAVALV